MTEEISNGEARTELSATAVGRLMGLATTSDLKILEGKIDLLTQKTALMAAKLEKLGQEISRLPTGADLERIDVHMGAIKAIVKELLEK